MKVKVTITTPPRLENDQLSLSVRADCRIGTRHTENHEPVPIIMPVTMLVTIPTAELPSTADERIKLVKQHIREALREQLKSFPFPELQQLEFSTSISI